MFSGLKNSSKKVPKVDHIDGENEHKNEDLSAPPKKKHKSARKDNSNEAIERDGDHDPLGDWSGRVDGIVDDFAQRVRLIGHNVVELNLDEEANEMERDERVDYGSHAEVEREREFGQVATRVDEILEE